MLRGTTLGRGEYASLDPRLEGLHHRRHAEAPAPAPRVPESVAGQALWSSSAWMPVA